MKLITSAKQICQRPSQHTWVPMKRGSRHEQCVKCRTVYPCRHRCEHLDCITERGEALPSWASLPEEHVDVEA